MDTGAIKLTEAETRHLVALVRLTRKAAAQRTHVAWQTNQAAETALEDFEALEAVLGPLQAKLDDAQRSWEEKRKPKSGIHVGGAW